MPRYLVKRQFPEGLKLPIDDAGAKAAKHIVEENATEGVT